MKAPTELSGAPRTDFLPTGNVDGNTLAKVYANARNVGTKWSTVYVVVTGDVAKIVTNNDYTYSLHGFLRNTSYSGTPVVDFVLYAVNVGVIYMSRISEASVISCRKLTGTNV